MTAESSLLEFGAEFLYVFGGISRTWMAWRGLLVNSQRLSSMKRRASAASSGEREGKAAPARNSKVAAAVPELIPQDWRRAGGGEERGPWHSSGELEVLSLSGSGERDGQNSVRVAVSFVRSFRSRIEPWGVSLSAADCIPSPSLSFFLALISNTGYNKNRALRSSSSS